METQRIFSIIVLLLLLGAGYYYYQASSVTPTAEGNQAIAELDAKLSDIRPLASVELDFSLFDNAFFRSLKLSTATTGPAVAPGRINPFIPLPR